MLSWLSGVDKKAKPPEVIDDIANVLKSSCVTGSSGLVGASQSEVVDAFAGMCTALMKVFETRLLTLAEAEAGARYLRGEY